jgi:hypothetical protein
LSFCVEQTIRSPDKSEQEDGADCRDNRNGTFVAANGLLESIGQCGRASLDGFPAEIPTDIVGKVGGRVVPPSSVLFQRLHYDPVQFVADQLTHLPGIRALVARNVHRFLARGAQSRARSRRIFFLDDSQHFGVTRSAKALTLERRAARQELIEEDA